MSMSDGDGQQPLHTEHDSESRLPPLQPNLPPALNPLNEFHIAIPRVFYQICPQKRRDRRDSDGSDAEEDGENDDDFDDTEEDDDEDEDTEEFYFFLDPNILDLFHHIISLLQPVNQLDREALTNALWLSEGSFGEIINMLSQKYDHPQPPSIACMVRILGGNFSRQWSKGLNSTYGGDILLSIVTLAIQRHLPQLCASEPDWPLLLITSRFGIAILNSLPDDTLKYIGRRQATIMGILEFVQQSIIDVNPAYEFRYLVRFLFGCLRPFPPLGDSILPFSTMYKAIAHHVSFPTATPASNQASPEQIIPASSNLPQDDPTLGMSDQQPSPNADHALSFLEDSKHLQPHVNCPTINYATGFDPDFYWFRYALTKYSSFNKDIADDILILMSTRLRVLGEATHDQMVWNRLALSYDEYSYYQLKESFNPHLNNTSDLALVMNDERNGDAQNVHKEFAKVDFDCCTCGRENCVDNRDCTCFCSKCTPLDLREAHSRDDVPPNPNTYPNKNPTNMLMHPHAVNRLSPPVPPTQTTTFPEPVYVQLPNLTANHPVFQSRGHSSRAMQVQDAVDSLEYQHFFVGSFLLGNNIMSALYNDNTRSTQEIPLHLFSNLQQLLLHLDLVASNCPALIYQLRLLQCRIYLLPSMRHQPIPRSLFVRAQAWPNPDQRMPSSLNPLFYLHLARIPPNFRYRPFGARSLPKDCETIRAALFNIVGSEPERWHSFTHCLLEELSGDLHLTPHLLHTVIIHSYDLYSTNRTTLHQYLYHEMQIHPTKTRPILDLLSYPFVYSTVIDTTLVHQHIVLCAHAGILNPTNVVDTPLASSPNHIPMKSKPSPNQIQALLHTQRELIPFKAIVYSYLMKHTGLQMVFPTPFGEIGSMLVHLTQTIPFSREDIRTGLQTQWHWSIAFGHSSFKANLLPEIHHPLESIETPGLATYSRLVIDDCGNILLAEKHGPNVTTSTTEAGNSQPHSGALPPTAALPPPTLSTSAPQTTTASIPPPVLPNISILALSHPFAHLTLGDITAHYTNARHPGNPTNPLKSDLDFHAYRNDAIESAQLHTITRWTQDQTDLVTELLTDDVLWQYHQTGRLPNHICSWNHVNAADQLDASQKPTRVLPIAVFPFLEENRPKMKVIYEYDYPHRFDNPYNKAEIELMTSPENVKLLKSMQLLDIQKRYKTYLKLLRDREEQYVSRAIVKVLKAADEQGIFNTLNTASSTHTPRRSTQDDLPTLPTYPFTSPPINASPQLIADWALEMLLVCSLNLQPHQPYYPEHFYQPSLPPSIIADAPAPNNTSPLSPPTLRAKVNAFLARPIQHQLVAHVAHIQPFPFTDRQIHWSSDRFPFMFESFLYYILESVLQTRQLLIPLLNPPLPVPVPVPVHVAQKRPRPRNPSDPL